MVVIAGICVVIYSFYFFLYSPLSNKVQEKSNQLVEKTETLAWMKKIKGAEHSVHTKENVSNSQLLTLLATQLKDNEELNFPYQLQQTSSGEIQLSFEEAPLNDFINWLGELNQNYAITIKQLDIERTKTPGITRIMIIINAAS